MFIREWYATVPNAAEDTALPHLHSRPAAFAARLSAVLALAVLSAQGQGKQMEFKDFNPVPAAAPAEPGALLLYPDTPPGAVQESWLKFHDDYIVRNVTRPSLTPFLPAPGKATGAAVIIAPGGAFMSLSMSHEGWNIARRLADHGIAAFVLKYRLNETPADNKAYNDFAAARLGAAFRLAPTGNTPHLYEPRATADALAAIRMVRDNAAKWGVDPGRVGIMGFSAGAMTALRSVLAATPETEPAFLAYIYGPMAPVNVPPGAPPMFAAIAADDGLFFAQGIGIVESWRHAHTPVELHMYERGNHGFGGGWEGTTTTMMLDEFIAWMRMHGWLDHPHA